MSTPSGFRPLNLPPRSMRDEHPGVVTARHVMGSVGGFAQIRPELNREPANGQYSAMNLLTSTHEVGNNYPSAVAVPVGVFEEGVSEEKFAHARSEAGLDFYVPIFADRLARVTLQRQTQSVLVGLGAVNALLHRLSRLLVDSEPATLQALHDHVWKRYNYLGPLTALTTDGSNPDRVATVARSGRAFIADLWRGAFGYFTSDDQRTIVREALGGGPDRDFPIPFDPYEIGNRLGFVLMWLPESFVVDPSKWSRSIPDLVAHYLSPQHSADANWTLQFVPVASNVGRRPSWDDLLGDVADAYLEAIFDLPTAPDPFFVPVGIVAPTALEAGEPNSGVGAPRDAIFPGPAYAPRRGIPIGDPISVYLPPGVR